MRSLSGPYKKVIQLHVVSIGIYFGLMVYSDEVPSRSLANKLPFSIIT